MNREFVFSVVMSGDVEDVVNAYQDMVVQLPVEQLDHVEFDFYEIKEEKE